MGIKIYKDNTWWRLEDGYILTRDFMGLDREKDWRLIDYIILHSREEVRKKVMRKYRITELPEETVNIEDKDDKIYRTYFLFREQVTREDDYDALKAVAFRNRWDDMSRFAFCRLTGFSWPPSECDAYSYRTYWCGLMSSVMREDIEALCHEMIDKDGPFASEAEEWLARLPEISDETLDEWASDNLERKENSRPHEALVYLLRPADGRKEFSEDELAEKIRGIADAWILMNYEEKNGKLSRREYSKVTDEFIRGIRDVLEQLTRDMISDASIAVRAVLLTGRRMPEDLTPEKTKEIIYSESYSNPLHGWYLDIADKYGIK